MNADPTDRYLAALAWAESEPVAGDADAAINTYLSLNAVYFLGKWLSGDAWHADVGRLSHAVGGLADLPVPSDRVRATQLAQHVRELTAVFGPSEWRERIAALTSSLVPAAPEHWDVAIRTAAREFACSGDGRPLLLAHARRRLWELSDRQVSLAPAPALAARMERAAMLAANRDGAAIQAAEALLAEASAVPQLARPLVDALAAGLRLSRPGITGRAAPGGRRQ